MLKYIIMLVVMFLAFTANIWLGVAVTAICVGYTLFAVRPSLYAAQGNKAFSNQDMAGARRWYQKAYDTGRASLNLKTGYAVLLMRLSAFNDAETVLNEIILDKTIAKDKKYTAKQYRALLYFKQGRPEEAMEEAAELFENFRNTTMYGLVGYLKLATNQPIEETLDFCLEAYDYNADDRDIQDNLVLAYYKHGEYEKAKEYADELLEGHPEFVEAVYHSALIALKQGDREQAREYIKKIDGCKRTGLTTVSEADVEELKKTLGMV